MYLTVSILLVLGISLGLLFKKFGLTEVLAYIFAGIIVGPALHLSIPSSFYDVATALALSFVGYTVGLTFSREFLRESGREVMIILVVEVLVTSFFVWLFIYLFTWNMPLSVVLASLAPATAPAGTVAVFRDLRSKGRLTDVATAVVGLDDAAGIIMYTVGIVITKQLLGSSISVTASAIGATWEIFGAFIIGALLGAATAYSVKAIRLSSDYLFVISISVALAGWGLG
jgi:Kef-type K+ transport system membrane component KefB